MSSQAAYSKRLRELKKKAKREKRMQRRASKRVRATVQSGNVPLQSVKSSLCK